VRAVTDDVVPFAELGNEFEVFGPKLVERQCKDVT
jgi:hypothetical protein